MGDWIVLSCPKLLCCLYNVSDICKSCIKSYSRELTEGKNAFGWRPVEMCETECHGFTLMVSLFDLCSPNKSATYNFLTTSTTKWLLPQLCFPIHLRFPSSLTFLTSLLHRPARFTCLLPDSLVCYALLSSNSLPDLHT